MGKSLFSACFGTTKGVADVEQSTSTSQSGGRLHVTQLQLVSRVNLLLTLGAKG